MRQVRAKFRCLGITHRYDHNIIAELGAVMNKKGDNFEENSSFWKYTPTGKAELVFMRDCDLEPGAYYYIDFVELKESTPEAWHLNHVRLSDNQQGDVSFSWYRQMPKDWDYKQPTPPGMHRGSLEMSIEGGKTMALSYFEKPGSLWKVTFTLAGPSDD